MLARFTHALTLLILLAAALVTLTRIHAFGQERFFTIDEYLYGHATWLVAQGKIPYLDFYEHHFPLGYVLHSQFLPEDPSSADKALWLRQVAFVYLLSASLLVGCASYVATRMLPVALLSSFLPAAFGFSLMSEVDYRVDNFAAFVFLGALALLEMNRRLDRRSLAFLAGVLAMIAVFMTQKMVVLVGGSIGLMIAFDGVRRWRRRGGADPIPLVRRLPVFAVGAVGVFAIGIGLALAFGLLPTAWEITVAQAIRHEREYPGVSWRYYAEPFFAATPYSTVSIGVFFLAWLAAGIRSHGFWLIPVAVVGVAGLLVKGQFPYNYVLICFLIVICALRGYMLVVESLELREGVGRALEPLLFLVPLVVLPDQMGFVAHASSNAHQLAILEKIDAWGSPDEVVIDMSGGAMFRPDSSYYWYHGNAHREMFREYFENEIVNDYRRSKALFWIEDFRLAEMPEIVQEYFRRHYVRLDGSLFSLGFTTPRTFDSATDFEIDVVREGEYFVEPIAGKSAAGSPADRPLFEIDSSAVRGSPLLLREGIHRIRLPKGSPAYRITWLPPAAFRNPQSGGREFSPLFEYRNAG